MSTIEPTVKKYPGIAEWFADAGSGVSEPRLFDLIQEELRLMEMTRERGLFIDPRFSRLSQNKARETAKKQAFVYMYGTPHLRRDDPIAKAFDHANQPWQMFDLDLTKVRLETVGDEVIITLSEPKTTVRTELLHKKVRDW